MDKQRTEINVINDVTLTFLTPYFHQGRGNATTAKRIVEGLKLNHLQTKVGAYDEEGFNSAVMENSQILHVLHYRRFADWLEGNNYSIDKPYVITSGGTDVNIDIFKEEHREKIGAVLKDAAAITVFSEDAKQKLQTVYPQLEDKIYIVKQSVWFPNTDDTVQNLKLPESGPNIVLPAGLRTVKDVLYTLPALVKLKKKYEHLTFTIIGAPLEQSVLDDVQEKMSKYSWINYYEEVPLEAMKEIYQQSDIIINSSHSEGQSSALLEAMFLGKPVVARNNGGNKSIIQHGKTGFIFNTTDEFYIQLDKLLSDENYKSQICRNALEYVKKFHSLQLEIDCYVDIYKKILNM